MNKEKHFHVILTISHVDSASHLWGQFSFIKTAPNSNGNKHYKNVP